MQEQCSNNIEQAFDKLEQVNEQGSDKSANKQNVVKLTSKARPVNPKADGYSIKEMAEMLGMKRPTLANNLRDTLSWDEFDVAGVALDSHRTSKVVYPINAWTTVLADLGKTLPAQLVGNFEVVDVEIEEPVFAQPGAITLKSETRAITPRTTFDLPDVHLVLPGVDDSAIAAQTEQFNQYADATANNIADLLKARFANGVQEIIRDQDNLLAGIRAQAMGSGATQAKNGESSAQ